MTDASIHPCVRGEEDQHSVGYLLLNLQNCHSQRRQVFGVASIGKIGKKVGPFRTLRQNLYKKFKTFWKKPLSPTLSKKNYNRMFNNTSVQDCKKNCSNKRSCRSFVYDKEKRQCFTFSKNDENKMLKDPKLEPKKDHVFYKKIKGIYNIRYI